MVEVTNLHKIEHPVFQRDHATLTMFYEMCHLCPFKDIVITFTAVDGTRRSKTFDSWDFQHVIYGLGMPIRGLGDGNRRGDVMLCPRYR